jgi:hypothetical protein
MSYGQGERGCLNLPENLRVIADMLDKNRNIYSHEIPLFLQTLRESANEIQRSRREDREEELSYERRKSEKLEEEIGELNGRLEKKDFYINQSFSILKSRMDACDIDIKEIKIGMQSCMHEGSKDRRDIKNLTDKVAGIQSGLKSMNELISINSTSKQSSIEESIKKLTNRVSNMESTMYNVGAVFTEND